MRDSWIEVKLDKVCGIHDNRRKPINTKERNKRIQGKDKTELYPYYGATGQVGFIDDYLIDGEYVLIGEDGAPFFDHTKNVAYLIKGKSWVNNHAHILLSHFSNKFLLHYLNTINFHGFVSGTTRLKLTQGSLKNIPVKLAPLPEQRAIVAKIEQLFSELDNGIANLKDAKDKLEIYRQAVLKKAFEGDDFKESKIEDITNKVQIGPFGSQLHKTDYIYDGIPLINPMHIQNGRIRPKKDFSISEEKRSQLPNYILENGDVIMGRRGEMGRCALITEKEMGWFCGTGSLFLRPDKSKIIPLFLFYYIGSPIVKQHLTGSATGTTMMNLNKKIIYNVPISVPISLDEQFKIVQEIESRLSVCDNILANIEESLEKSEALRQSILKQAFEGKLLSEEELEACRREPYWEPAEKLLERIKSEKSANA